ncbi:MAG: carbohydrate-binding domain-containing protein [Chloroflexi bacterium]|nr:carbohydrate-binding domain-containing protein [Chloroflexota bacterium]
MKWIGVVGTLSVLALMVVACSVNESQIATQLQQAIVPNTPNENTPVERMGAVSIVETLVADGRTHEAASDYQWDEAAVVPIVLDGDTIRPGGNGVAVQGSRATITSAGTYRLSGKLTNGQIRVDTGDAAPVRLILDGVELHNPTGAAIYVAHAAKTLLVLAGSAENRVSDGSEYLFEKPGDDEPNAAIFSKSNLTIFGSGALHVSGAYNDGITSKDGLILAGGTVRVDAVDDGLRGKDYLVVRDARLQVTAGGDGLKSDRAGDASLGYISIESGDITIEAGEDAIQADNTVAVNGGTLTITSGDDGIHADTALEIAAGVVRVLRSYEGIESATITILGGQIYVVSTDDGVNVAGGKDASGTRHGPDQSSDTFTNPGQNYLYLHGGYLVVDSGGDGIDVNGAIEMTDGTVLLNGPTQRRNSALDYDASFDMTGGFLAAAGSSGMSQAPSISSGQPALLINFDTPQPAGSLFRVQDGAGNGLITFAPEKEYQSVAFSSPRLVDGGRYEVYLGGQMTGDAVDGLYPDGVYTPGKLFAGFTVQEGITRIGLGGSRPR